MRTDGTQKFMQEHGIVGLSADKTREAPEVDELMVKLGHTSKVIPYYAIFPGDGGDVIKYDAGPLLEGQLLQMLTQAGPSRTLAAAETAMAK